jgi:GWxTD domain-containing protein
MRNRPGWMTPSACWHAVLFAALLGAATVLLPPAGRAQQAAPPQLAVAESALAHGDFDRAVELARAYTGHHQNDWRGWLVQGEATLKRGGSDNAYRVAAVIAFRHATQLAPQRVEVWGGYGRAGLELGSADGEQIVHDAFERVMALEPLYRGAWEGWLQAYRSRDDRQRMERILARHDSILEVQARIARLDIENERYARADTLLDALLRLDPGQPEWLALRAQSALEAGDLATGIPLYDQALADADRPGGEMLWQQAIGVATPAEIRAWEAGVPAAERPGFLRSFWARRNPDLFAGINERIAEHFARLRVARREFQDTHPLSGYENRAATRALNARPLVGEQIFYQRCEAQLYPGGPIRAEDRARDPGIPRLAPSYVPILLVGEDTFPIDHALAAIRAEAPFLHGIHPPGELFIDPQKVNIGLFDVPYGRDIRDVDTTAAAMGYNRRTGLDDRGLTYLRFGPPRKRIIGSQNGDDQFCQVNDLEHWEYADIGDVRFFRPEAVNVGVAAGWATTGTKVFRPMNEPQFEATELAMTRNATSVPAPLGFGVWTAQLADPDDVGVTDVVVATTRGAVAASLDGLLDAGDVWIDHRGVTTVRSEPGTYVLLAQAQDSGQLGRQSLPIVVRPFERMPAVSDLLVAPAWGAPVSDRAAMLAHLQRTLVFPRGSTIRGYAEVYGLHADSGTVRYQTAYELLRTDDPARDLLRADWPDATRFDFQRSRRAAPSGIEIETLDIVPARVPPGRYLLRVRIADLVSGRDAGYGSIGFIVR